MKKHIQSTIQILFLLLFIGLLILGKIQIWMGLFLIGVIATILFGRLYCGFICPINTIMKFETYIKRKFKIRNFNYPKFLENKIVKYIGLGLFFALFAIVLITKKSIPVLPGLLLIGVVLTLFFPEKLWHKFLCPYGTILSLPGKFSKKRLEINSSKCNNCGACYKVCPADAIVKNEHSHFITKKECITCFNCQRVCKQDAIKYN